MFNKSNKYSIQKLLSLPVFLSHESEKDILIFRRTIEAAMKLGYWNGFIGSS